METKKISELTMMEAVSDAANVLVEENGEAKRVPANKLGSGLTVPVGSPDTLTWDGNTEGLVSAIGGMYKISDAIPTKAECLSATVTFINNTTNEKETAVLSDNSFMDMDYGCFMCIAGFAVVPAEAVGQDVSGVTFNEAGFYVTSMPDCTFVSLTIPGYTGFPVQEKIAPSYLYQPDWNQTDETAADFFKNKPFGDELVEIMPETEVTGTETNGLYVVELAPSLFSGNEETLIVNFDGVEYTCSPAAYDFKVFGNTTMIGEELGGEDIPFLVDPFGLLLGTPILLFGDAEPHTVAIRAVRPLPLNVKYLPVTTFYVDANTPMYLYADVGLTTKATEAEVMAAMMSCLITVGLTGQGLGGAIGFANPVLVSFAYEYAHMVVATNINSDGTLEYSHCYTAEYTPPEST